MADERILSSVTVVGSLVERPDFSKTEMCEPLARFWIEHGNNQVQCFAVGAMAESLLRFGRAGVELLGHGHLEWFHGDSAQPYVLLDRLGFVNPAELPEYMR